MKRGTSIVLGIVSWVAIIAYFVAASRYCRIEREKNLCRGLRVTVLDSAERGFITSGMVKNWFALEQQQFLREPIDRINTLDVEAFVRRRGFVKEVHAYTTMDGMLNIELTQRKPILRVNSINGYDFYVTDDNYILPTQRYYTVYVPVVTGMVRLPFAPDYVGSLDKWAGGEDQGEKKVSENYSFLANLINFVKFVEEDGFWNAFWVQINIRDSGQEGRYDPQVELVPRLGDQIVCMGSLDDYRGKLTKLMSFYRNGLDYTGWESCHYIDLRYRSQVVCSE